MSKKDTFVVKVKNKDGSDIYVKTEWSESSFELWVLAGESLWTGQCSNEDLHRDSEKYVETPENYYNNARTCLTTYEENHRYELMPINDDNKLFLWKVLDKRIRIRGAVLLRLSNGSVVNEMMKIFLDYLIENQRMLVHSYNLVTIEKDQVQMELMKSLENLQQVTDMKSEMESILYGKFVQLLNSKKRRIALLEQSIRNVNGEVDKSMESQLN